MNKPILTDINKSVEHNAIYKIILNEKTKINNIISQHDIIYTRNSINCLYCNSVCKSELTLKLQTITCGFFCSELCLEIFKILLSSLFCFRYTSVIKNVFLPYELIDAIDFNRIKSLYNTDTLSMFYIIRKGVIHITIRFIDKTVYDTIKLIMVHIKCIYCKRIINPNMLLNTVYGNIRGFCSRFCTQIISKYIERSMLPYKMSSISMIPFTMVNKNIYKIIDKNTDPNICGIFVLKHSVIEIITYVPK